MATVSPKRSSTSSTCHVRSISLPPRSHPTTLKIFEGLKRKGSVSAYESIRSGIVCLEELFEAVNGFLDLTSARRAVSFNKNERVLDEVLDASIWLLDACAVTREAVLRIKEHCRQVRSLNRRSNPDPNYIRAVLSNQTGFKKVLKKDVRRAVACLIQIENNFTEKESRSPVMDHVRNTLFAELREAYATGASVLQAILSRLVTEKKSKLFALFKLAASFEDEGDQVNDLEMGNLEDELDVLYRKLIRTRASLLNIFSL